MPAHDDEHPASPDKNASFLAEDAQNATVGKSSALGGEIGSVLRKSSQMETLPIARVRQKSLPPIALAADVASFRGMAKVSSPISPSI